MHINCCWLFLVCSRVGGLSCTDGTLGLGKAARDDACSPDPRFTTGTCSRATLSIVSSNTCTRRHGKLVTARSTQRQSSLLQRLHLGMLQRYVQTRGEICDFDDACKQCAQSGIGTPQCRQWEGLTHSAGPPAAHGHYPAADATGSGGQLRYPNGAAKRQWAATQTQSALAEWHTWLSG